MALDAASSRWVWAASAERGEERARQNPSCSPGRWGEGLDPCPPRVVRASSGAGLLQALPLLPSLLTAKLAEHPFCPPCPGDGRDSPVGEKSGVQRLPFQMPGSHGGRPAA